jgi:hypothetical protein
MKPLTLLLTEDGRSLTFNFGGLKQIVNFNTFGPKTGIQQSGFQGSTLSRLTSWNIGIRSSHRPTLFNFFFRHLNNPFEL